MFTVLFRFIHRFIALLEELFFIQCILAVYNTYAYGYRRKSVIGILELAVDLVYLVFDKSALHSA